jgi:hypothetical protein
MKEDAVLSNGWKINSLVGRAVHKGMIETNCQTRDGMDVDAQSVTAEKSNGVWIENVFDPIIKVIYLNLLGG